MPDYDLLVIGSGPAGQRGAVQAAKEGKRVALVERNENIGGVTLNTGTILSKELREAAIYLTGYWERGVYGESFRVKQDIGMQDLLVRTAHVMRNEIDVIRHHLLRNRVELVTAEASFIDPHTIHLSFPDGKGYRDVSSAKVLIATGSSSTWKPESCSACISSGKAPVSWCT